MSIRLHVDRVEGDLKFKSIREAWFLQVNGEADINKIKFSMVQGLAVVARCHEKDNKRRRLKKSWCLDTLNMGLCGTSSILANVSLKGYNVDWQEYQLLRDASLKRSGSERTNVILPIFLVYFWKVRKRIASGVSSTLKSRVLHIRCTS